MIGFDIVLTTLRLRWNNVDTTLYQRCATFFRRCFDVGFWRYINFVQHWKTHVGFCFNFNVGSTLFQRWSITLKQRWSDVEMLAGINSRNSICYSGITLYLLRYHSWGVYVLIRFISPFWLKITQWRVAIRE